MSGKTEGDAFLTRGLVVIFSFLLLALVGCYEPIEGCLDVQATKRIILVDVAHDDAIRVVDCDAEARRRN